MTKDFRNVGRLPEPPQAARPAHDAPAPGQPPGTAQQRKFVLLSIRLAALMFFLAGLWLITGGNSPIPAEIAPIVGVAFIISAIADILIIKLMKHMWAKLDAKLMAAETSQRS